MRVFRKNGTSQFWYTLNGWIKFGLYSQRFNQCPHLIYITPNLFSLFFQVIAVTFSVSTWNTKKNSIDKIPEKTSKKKSERQNSLYHFFWVYILSFGVFSFGVFFFNFFFGVPRVNRHFLEVRNFQRPNQPKYPYRISKYFVRVSKSISTPKNQKGARQNFQLIHYKSCEILIGH